ncbi:MAG TPA: NADH-quinone oxidoreductase subunit NuoH [Dehalococcoidia bacterium]|nr:NADH-quinone oxidoreductase subunit NuoH [Dehalococcoidia bacterium]
MPNLIQIVIALFVVLLIVMGIVAALTYAERKFLGHVQMRLGPMRVGPHGLFQAPADVIKLIIKEDLVPANADKIVFRLAPFIVFTPVFMLFVTIPFARDLVIRNLDLGLFYLVAIPSITVVGYLMAGFGSGNKYALLGGARTAAQLVSYEIPLVLALVTIAMIADSLSLTAIAEQQREVPFILLQPVGLFVFLTAALAEANRTPFDITHAESEIVGGPTVEYSGVSWAMFFLAEYANIIVISSVTTILYLGAWHGPGSDLVPGLGLFWFAAKAAAVILFIFWLRATFPRLRIDQLMAFCWKVLIPVAFANLVLTGVFLVFGPLAFTVCLAAALILAAVATRPIWQRRIGRGLLRSLRTTSETIARTPVTVQYPVERIPVHRRFRGIPALLWDDEVGEPKCVACDICARECPVDVIHTSGRPNPKAKTGESSRKRIVDQFDLNFALCIYCGICVEVCPFDALAMSRTYEIAAESPDQFVLHRDQLLELTMGRKPPADDVPSPESQTPSEDGESAIPEPVGAAAAGDRGRAPRAPRTTSGPRTSDPATRNSDLGTRTPE